MRGTNNCWAPGIEESTVLGRNDDAHRVVSRAGLFGSGSGLKFTKMSGLIRALDVLFAISAQKYNQNNLVTLLNFSDLT